MNWSQPILADVLRAKAAISPYLRPTPMRTAPNLAHSPSSTFASHVGVARGGALLLPPESANGGRFSIGEIIPWWPTSIALSRSVGVSQGDDAIAIRP